MDQKNIYIFLEFIEKFGHFFWMWPFIKIHIIYCVVAQIIYLGKVIFLGYGPKCSWPIRL